MDYISLSPNPTTGIVSIEVVLIHSNADDPITIIVTDLTGITRFNATYNDGIVPGTLNFSGLEAGNYFISATQSGYMISTGLSIH